MNRKSSISAILLLFAGTSFVLGWLSNDVLELPIRELEERINLDGKDNWSFHSVLEDPERHGFRFPGYLIGIEKTDKEILGLAASDSVFDLPKLRKGKIASIRSAVNDEDRLFLSHIIEYGNNPESDLGGIASDVFYSVFDPQLLSNRPLPFGFQALENLGSELDSALKASEISHLIVVSMGWNTPQIEAIGDINSLIGGLIKQAKKHVDSASFRPLVIGVTWPSQSKVSRFNYLSKSYDADELGVVWIKELITRVIAPIKENHDLTVLFLGHSLGARALTMGLFASSWEGSGYGPANSVDALIGYAPAFSINRFIETQGIEGAPFADFKKLNSKLFYSWSKHDSAMRIGQAYLTKHMGGAHAAELATEYQDLFFMTSSAELKQGISAKPGSKIAYIDISEFSKYETYHNESGGAHSDIFRAESSEFLWKLLQDNGLN